MYLSSGRKIKQKQLWARFKENFNLLARGDKQIFDSLVFYIYQSHTDSTVYFFMEINHVQNFISFKVNGVISESLISVFHNLSFRNFLG